MAVSLPATASSALYSVSVAPGQSLRLSAQITDGILNATGGLAPALYLQRGSPPSEQLWDMRAVGSSSPLNYIWLPEDPAGGLYYALVAPRPPASPVFALWIDSVCPNNCSADGLCQTGGPSEGLCVCDGVVLSSLDCSLPVPGVAEYVVLTILTGATLLSCLFGAGYYYYRRSQLLAHGYATVR